MIYNIVLNTKDRSNLTATDSIARSEFFFDWTVLPEAQYKMTFSFESTSVNLATIQSIPIISANLGQSNVYVSDSRVTSARTSNIIGILSPYVVSNSSYLYADRNINNSIILNRPCNNNFRIDITKDDYTSNWTDNAGATMTSYVLTLSLEEI